MDGGYLLEHNLCFDQKYENNKKNSTENFHFYSREKLLYVAWGCFVMSKMSIHSKRRLPAPVIIITIVYC